MLSDRLVNVIRRRNLPESEQLRSRKWRQVIATVDWLTSQFQPEDRYQIYMFNNVTEPVIRGTEGVWLTADDGVQLDEAVRVLRRTPPKNGTNMHSAFAVAKSLSPRPDRLIRRTCSRSIAGASFIACATAWLDSSAGIMPSVRVRR